MFFLFDRLNILCASGKYLPSNGAAGRAGGLNMAFDPHKAKNAGAEGLCGVSHGESRWKRRDKDRSGRIMYGCVDACIYIYIY